MSEQKVVPFIVGTVILLLSILTLSHEVWGVEPQAQTPADLQVITNSAFSYQGTLSDGSAPADGPYDFEFALFDSDTGGTQVGSTVTLNDVMVENGLFTVLLDFGATAFEGSARWLDVSVRPGDSSGAYTPLGRQELTPVPYALTLRPGATISGTVANGHALEVVNRYDSGTIGSALVGRASADTSPAIAAYHEGTGHALYGSTASGDPTIGGVNDAAGNAVDGQSELGVGVYGATNNSDGTNGSYGVVGLHPGYAVSDTPETYWRGGGFFAGDNGVVGLTNESGGFGVFGYNAAASFGSGYAGRFISENGNGVRISTPDNMVGLRVSGGSLLVDSGSKSAVVPTDQGDRLLYAEEATEHFFTDYGFGQLSGGVASITIDPLFAQTVNLDYPYHVFVQVYGDADVYVDNRTVEGFDVILREGDGDAEFSYRIVARRLGYETDRLESAPWETPGAPSDSVPVQGSSR